MLPGGAGLGQGHRSVGKGRDLGFHPLDMSLTPRLLPVPLSAAPTTMLSLQLTTDAPSPCWALKVWKVWEPAVLFSSSGGYKKGWGAEAWLSTLLLPPSLSLLVWDSLRSKGSEVHWPPSALQGHRNTPPVSS